MNFIVAKCGQVGRGSNSADIICVCMVPKLRSVLRTEERYRASDEEKARVNEEAGKVLELANKFAEEAGKFVQKSSGAEVDSTDKENYSPEARMFFLQLKWFWVWNGAAYDLGLRAWAQVGPGGTGWLFNRLKN